MRPILLVASQQRTTSQPLGPGLLLKPHSCTRHVMLDTKVGSCCPVQGFHWFAHEAALAEIYRALRPGAGLALLWNREDDSVPWAAELLQVRLLSLLRWHNSPHLHRNVRLLADPNPLSLRHLILCLCDSHRLTVYCSHQFQHPLSTAVPESCLPGFHNF